MNLFFHSSTYVCARIFFLCFVNDALPAFTINVNNFKLNFRILPERGCIQLIATNK